MDQELPQHPQRLPAQSGLKVCKVLQQDIKESGATKVDAGQHYSSKLELKWDFRQHETDRPQYLSLMYVMVRNGSAVAAYHKALLFFGFMGPPPPLPPPTPCPGI